MRWRWASIIAVSVASLAPGAAASALTPVPVRTVLSTDRIDSLTAAALADGRVAVGWTDGNNNEAGTAAMIRPAGGLLPPAYESLRPGYAGESLTFLTGGPSSAPLLIYFQDNDDNLPFAVELNGDVFGGQRTLSGYKGRFPRLARCPDGSTLLGYQATDSEVTPTKYYITAEPRGPQGEPVTISYYFVTSLSEDSFQEPTPTCDESSLPLLSWVNDPDGNGPAPPVMYVEGLAHSTPSMIFERKAPAGVLYGEPPDARIAPDGRIWITWTESTATESTTYVATRAPGVTTPIPTSSPTVLDAQGAGTTLFFGPGGTTDVLLSHYNQTTFLNSYGVRTAALGASSFGPEQPLLGEGHHYAQPLLGNPDGAPRLLVAEYGEESPIASYSIEGIPAAGSNEPLTPTGLAPNRGSAAFAYLPSGDLFGVASTEIGPDNIALIEGGLSTGVPPALESVSVPALAAPGMPTPLSVHAFSALGLSSFSWHVGGQTIAAQDTSFTFPAPGTYEVTATAVDRLGLTTSVTRTVRVLDPNAVSPGAGDHTPPRLTAHARRGKKGKAAKVVTLSLRCSEPAAADIELIGTLKRRGSRGTLIMASTHLSRVSTTKRYSVVRLTVKPALAKLVGGKLSVRVTLTDLAGNRAEKTVAVSTPKAKPGKKKHKAKRK